MTLIVEDGSGTISGANSYVTVTEAEEYLVVSDTPPAAAWLTLTLTQQERTLMNATRILEQYTIWSGEKSFPTTQALSWPRKFTVDCNGEDVPSDEVPLRVKHAVIEMAVFYSQPGNSPGAIADNDGLKSAVIDVLEFVWKDNYDPNANLRMPPGLNHLLCGLGRFSAGNKIRQWAYIKRS
jgi:hypothetical protein